MADSGSTVVEGGGIQRTLMNCHNCSGDFVAELDMDVNGNYEIPCPRCGHKHYREVKGGKVTEGRYGSDSSTSTLAPRSVWKTEQGAKTTTVAWHIRERWLNRSDTYGR